MSHREYISTCAIWNNIPNTFFENQLSDTGVLQFIDVTDRTGTQFLPNSYGSQFADFDDDGDLDLYMIGAQGNPNELWRNEGDGTFAHVHDIVQDEVLYQSSTTSSVGGQAADYDLDGDLDLFASTGAGLPQRFFVNNASTNGNQWLYVRLKGTEKNPTGIGAQV